MFDFDPGKFLIIGVVALIVIGPKELPRVLRQVGQAVSRMKRMAAEFQGQFMDAMKEADLDSIREEVKKIGAEADINHHFDPAREIQRELTTALDQPKAADAIPALADVAGPTDGFALPAPAEIAASEAGGAAQPVDLMQAYAATPAAAGMAPDADFAEAPAMSDPGVLNGAEVLKKRKIRMPKRQQPAISRVHVVYDRTAVPRGRLVLARSQDMAER